jgi:hypothetical protein
MAKSGGGNNFNIKDYWLKGAGAAKVRWGTPGDFTRCVGHLKGKVPPGSENRICAQWVKDATGKWNAEGG